MIPELAADSVLCTLKRLLKQRNRSYGDVAKHLGVSRSTVKRMLNKASVPFDVLVRIAELLEISVFELMREACSPICSISPRARRRRRSPESTASGRPAR